MSAKQLNARVRFATPRESLTANELAALQLLARVAKVLDKVYTRQRWAGNEALAAAIPAGSELDRLFKLHKGPWEEILGSTVHGVAIPDKLPLGANFYPEDMSVEDFQEWIGQSNSTHADAARSFYTVIRRDAISKELQIRRYADEYADLLAPAMRWMQEAADLLHDQHPALARFLSSRANSFVTDDYYNSEFDWLAVGADSKFEITVGPYEVYTDQLMCLKAAFEIFIHVRDVEGTESLKVFSSRLQQLENNLPVPQKYKKSMVKTGTPILVVNEIFNGGDASGTIMTSAYNLPNDERVTEKAGSKLILIKNVQQAKFEHILLPICNKLLSTSQAKDVTFDAFFTHVLLHEMSHSLGPMTLVADSNLAVRSALQELHSCLEEAKADIVGLWAASLFIRERILPASMREQFHVTFLGSSFRSLRFGLNEAHGRGHAIQMNYLLDLGGYEYDSTAETFSVNFEKIDAAVESLAAEIMIIQGDGDKAKALEFVGKYAVIRPEVEKALGKLSAIPVDIDAEFDLLS